MFQSTRPMRGATRIYNLFIILVTVSIHAPHAGRDRFRMSLFPILAVSIHAPHAGRDSSKPYIVRWSEVSIHAPHAGRDLISLFRSPRMYRFNPRAPCGARQVRLA